MRDDFDGIIKKGVLKMAEKISLSEYESEKLLSDILEKTEERSKVMRLSRAKKMAFALAAVFVIGSITAVAAGKISGLTSSIDLRDAMHSVSEVQEEAFKKLEVRPELLESFKNGFKFEQGFVNSVEMTDENGEGVGAFPQMTADYADENGRRVFYYVSKPTAEYKAQQPSKAEDKAAEYNGIDVSYTETDYLFLPAGEEPSEEELERANKGELVTAYGTEEREMTVMKNVSWTKDGLEYMFTSEGEDIEKGELLEMAREIIEAGKN